MKYFKIIGGTDYCGTDFEEFIPLENEDAEDEIFLANIAEELAYDNAVSYEYLAEGWEDGDFESEEAKEAYYAGCWSFYEEVPEEKFLEQDFSQTIEK